MQASTKQKLFSGRAYDLRGTYFGIAKFQNIAILIAKSQSIVILIAKFIVILSKILQKVLQNIKSIAQSIAKIIVIFCAVEFF